MIAFDIYNSWAHWVLWYELRYNTHKKVRKKRNDNYLKAYKMTPNISWLRVICMEKPCGSHYEDHCFDPHGMIHTVCIDYLKLWHHHIFRPIHGVITGKKWQKCISRIGLDIMRYKQNSISVWLIVLNLTHDQFGWRTHSSFRNSLVHQPN